MIWDEFKIWDDLRSGCGCEICGCGWVSLALLSILVVVVDVVGFFFFFFFGVRADIGCSVCLSFFFFLGSSG